MEIGSHLFSTDLTSLSVDFSGSGEEIRGRSSGQSSGMDLQPPSLIFDMKYGLSDISRSVLLQFLRQPDLLRSVFQLRT
jgi:hypothetical protein